MNKQQIDCFLAVAEKGSIAAAASELYLATQAVSQHIRNLEKETGVILFTRNKNGVCLTEAGKTLQEYAIKWHGLFDHTIHKIEEHYAAMATSFRIGISEYVNILGEISGGIAAFREAHSNITMTGKHYKNKTLLREVENGDLDVAVINELQIVSGGDFDYMPIAKEDLRIYFSGMIPQGDETPPQPTYGRNLRIPIESNPELAAYSKTFPHISTSYGVWNKNDWEEVSRRTSAFLGYEFTSHYEAVNFRSAVLNLKHLPCSIVCDARFGYLPKNSGIYNLPIPVESNLCCLWHKKNENPLIRDFTEHMQNYFRSCPKTTIEDAN